jgi:tetratricopeptide (TPR) repeat protein
MNHAAIVERIHHGQSSIVLGGMPELPETLAVVRVRCDFPGKIAPLERACRRIERLIDGETLAHKELFRQEAVRSVVDRFVAACNRLASHAPGNAVLVFDRIEAADESAHHVLAQLLHDRAKFRLPLLLVVRGEMPESLRELVEALERPLERRPHVRPLRSTDATMKRVLRAAAVAGESFTAAPIAALLALSTDDVLEALQCARDAGIDVRDHGDGRFSLPPKLASMLHASVLPSLRARWAERLGAPARVVAPKADALGDRLEGVTRLVRAGDVKEASEELAKVQGAIAALPAGAATTLLAARAMLERARLRWLGAGVDPTFTLDGALEEALAARGAFGEAAPARMRADVAAVIAGIAYDLGDGASVERATLVLSETIAFLLREGATLEAAMLLNDQAALELRIGRSGKACGLAIRSLDLLGARVKEAPTDAAARADLAATHHLLARMPLHGPPANATPEAIDAALAHVADAEREYRTLGMRRDLGRATETRARLEAKRGHMDTARLAFEAALHLADDAADLTGLARVTAGLAELLTAAGNPRDALGLLASSIELNREKGSPIGLAFDERALAQIEDAAFALPVPDTNLVAELARTRERLTRALDLDGG